MSVDVYQVIIKEYLKTYYNAFRCAYFRDLRTGQRTDLAFIRQAANYDALNAALKAMEDAGLRRNMRAVNTALSSMSILFSHVQTTAEAAALARWQFLGCPKDYDE